MTQLTLGIDRLSNSKLAAFGYQLPSMDKQTESRFGRLMIKQAKVDKMYRPEKNIPSAEPDKKMPSGDVALNMAWGGV